MNTAYAYMIVFLGAGAGGALRHAVNVLGLRIAGPDLPAGTFVVNVVGSFAIGAVAGYFALKGDGGRHAQLFLTTGVLGGFTTFSAFSLETVLMLERGELGAAALYAVGSVVLSVAALFAGLALTRT